MERYVLDLLPGEKPGMEYLMKGTTVIVKEVKEGSAAEAAGVPVGCIIDRINGAPIGTAEDLVRELQGARGELVLDVHREDRVGSSVEASIVTPHGKGPAIIKVHRSYMRVASEQEMKEIALHRLTHATLLELMTKRGREEVVCFHTRGDYQPALILTEVDWSALITMIDMRLENLNLPPLPVDDSAIRGDGTPASGPASASDTASAAPSDGGVSLSSTGRFIAPLLRGVRSSNMSFHCRPEVLESVAATGQFREPGVVAEDLPDTFACIKPLLARRGGALVYFAAVCKEGLVVVGAKAIYRFVPDEGLQHTTPDVSLSRCIPYSEISEMVLGSGEGHAQVALRIPRQHDELLTLPTSALEAWEHAVCTVYHAVMQYGLPTRRIGEIRRKDLLKKLFLPARAGAVKYDDIPLTYRNDAIVGITTGRALVEQNAELTRLCGKIEVLESMFESHLHGRRVGGDVGGGGQQLQVPSQVDVSTTPTMPLEARTQQPVSFATYGGAGGGADGVPPQQSRPIDEAVFSPDEVLAIKAKQAEVASLRSLLDAANRGSQRHASASPPPAAHSPPAPAAMPVVPHAMHTMHPMHMHMAHPAFAAHTLLNHSTAASTAKDTEREFLREQVGVLSQQLRSMVDELSDMKDAEGVPAELSAPPPLASLGDEAADRLEAIEALVRDSMRRDSEPPPPPTPTPSHSPTPNYDEELSKLASQARATAMLLPASRTSAVSMRRGGGGGGGTS